MPSSTAYFQFCSTKSRARSAKFSATRARDKTRRAQRYQTDVNGQKWAGRSSRSLQRRFWPTIRRHNQNLLTRTTLLLRQTVGGCSELRPSPTTTRRGAKSGVASIADYFDRLQLLSASTRRVGGMTSVGQPSRPSDRNRWRLALPRRCQQRRRRQGKVDHKAAACES